MSSNLLQPKKTHRVRNFFLIVAALFVGIIVIANLQPAKHPTAPSQTTTSSQTTTQPSPTPVAASPEPSPAPSDNASSNSSNEALSMGQEYHTKSFAIKVPEDKHVEFTEIIGNYYEVEDKGTWFCLVPLCIGNETNATKSLIGVSWYLYTPSGKRFEPATMADYYLPKGEKINPVDIPPDVKRCGKLVFLVTDAAKESNSLTLEARGFSFHVRFNIH